MMSKKQIGWGIVAVAAILATLFFGVNYPVPPAPEFGTGALDGVVESVEEGSRALTRPVQFRSVNVAQDLTVGGDTTVGGDATVGDDLTVTGDIGVGAGFPLENGTAGRILEFGATGAISVTAVTPVAITTVTAYGCNVKTPTAAAQYCGATISGNTLTFTIYNSAVTPVAVVTPHAAGASFWIGGTD